MRFWEQFETQIDKYSTPEITKFSYLKELVDLNLIDGLPFTPKGYKKAKDLLARRYRKESEVVGTYLRNILELSTVREGGVKKIDEFYEKLLFNVESLQTLHSINKLGAAVRFTLDKLDVIKNELAMIWNENWSEWTFVQFLEALEKCTFNNPVQGVESAKTKAVAAPVNRERNQKRSTRNVTEINKRTSEAVYFARVQILRLLTVTTSSVLKREKKVFLGKRMCFNC